MQSLNIFRVREGIYFAFQSLEGFEIYLEKYLNWAWPTRQHPFRPRARCHSDCGRRCLSAPPIFPQPLSPCSCTPVKSSTPFSPSPHAHRSPLLSLLLSPCLLAITDHLLSPSLPSKPGERLAIFLSSRSARWELELTVTVARRPTSPSHHFPPSTHHRPLSSVHLWPRHHFEEDRTSPQFAYINTFIIYDRLSELLLSSSPPPTTSLPFHRSGEPLPSQLPPVGPSWTQHLPPLHRHGGRKGIGIPYFGLMGRKA
jgi:hypothetical protein